VLHVGRTLARLAGANLACIGEVAAADERVAHETAKPAFVSARTSASQEFTLCQTPTSGFAARLLAPAAVTGITPAVLAVGAPTATLNEAIRSTVPCSNCFQADGTTTVKRYQKSSMVLILRSASAHLEERPVSARRQRSRGV